LWAIVVVILLAGPAPAVRASHSWSNYHWSRAANPFSLGLIDSVTSSWDGNYSNARLDWSESDKFDLIGVAGRSTTSARKRCATSSGQVRVCNAVYGANGWLGLAEIWIIGSHVQYARVRVNDSYFNTSSYNDANAKRHVLCQEVGHTLGLDHQHGEVVPTCMDDESGLFDAAYVSPNYHDFEELDAIYTHLDGTSSSTQSTQSTQASEHGNDPNKRVERDGQYTKITWIFPARNPNN
jgi:hypothetical protein